VFCVKLCNSYYMPIYRSFYVLCDLMVHLTHNCNVVANFCSVARRFIVLPQSFKYLYVCFEIQSLTTSL